MPNRGLTVFTFDGDSSAGRFPGDLVGEACAWECAGREGRREAGSRPAHVPVVALSRAAGTSGGRSGTEGVGGGGGRGRNNGRRGRGEVR